jgi:hypothetical protein
MSAPSAPSPGRFWVMAACVAVTGITVRLLMLGKTGGHPGAAVTLAAVAALIGWRAASAGDTGGGDAPETPASRQKPRIELRDLLRASYIGYARFWAAFGSILRLLLAFGFFWVALKIAEFGWDLRLLFRVPCLVGAVWTFVLGFDLAMAALPGLTPQPRQYEPGRARTATLNDVRRSGLLEE